MQWTDWLIWEMGDPNSISSAVLFWLHSVNLLSLYSIYDAEDNYCLAFIAKQSNNISPLAKNFSPVNTWDFRFPRTCTKYILLRSSVDGSSAKIVHGSKCLLNVGRTKNSQTEGKWEHRQNPKIKSKQDQINTSYSSDKVGSKCQKMRTKNSEPCTFLST